jgi:Ca2+-binding RTX toxin-like protein
MTIFTGTNGDDFLPPPGADVSGNDQFFALDGKDRVLAGLGNDQVDGSSGNDILYGQGGDDDLSGGADNDQLYGGDGIDHLDGGGGNDFLNGGAGADTMVGNFGNDTYNVDDVGDTLIEFSAGDGIDYVQTIVTFTLPQFVDNMAMFLSAPIDGTGNAGANHIIGNGAVNHLNGLDGNDILDGNNGADVMAGGLGADRYYVDNLGDVVDETGGDGVDTVYSSIGFDLANASVVHGRVENLILTSAGNVKGYGNALDNAIVGNAGNNILLGRDGNDSLKGQAGNDQIVGGVGADQLSGGSEADAFRFLSLNDSTVASTGRDTLIDFSTVQGDKIDLSAIDAVAGAIGNQQFTFIGSAAFSGTSGELRFQQIGANLLVSGDVNGNGVADFALVLKGVASLQATDFNL